MYRCRLLALYSSSLFSSAWGSSRMPSHLRLSLLCTSPRTRSPLLVVSGVVASNDGKTFRPFCFVPTLLMNCSPFFSPVVLLLCSRSWHRARGDTGKVSGGKDSTWGVTVREQRYVFRKMYGAKQRLCFRLLMTPSGVAGIMAGILSCDTGGLLTYSGLHHHMILIHCVHLQWTLLEWIRNLFFRLCSLSNHKWRLFTMWQL